MGDFDLKEENTLPKHKARKRYIINFTGFRENPRGFLATFSLSVLLVIVLFVVWKFFTSGPRSSLPDLSFNDLTKAAIDIRLDQTRSLFQIGLTLLIALWGLLIAKKEEAGLVLEDRPELIMISSATTLILLSFVCHVVYLDVFTYSYFSGGEEVGRVIRDSLMVGGNKETDPMKSMPNVFDPEVNYLFVAQGVFLVAGLVNAVITFISAHKLKPKP